MEYRAALFALFEPRGEVIYQGMFPECCFEFAERTQVEGGGTGFAETHFGGYLRKAKAFAVDAVELSDDLLFLRQEAFQSVFDALLLSCAQKVLVVLLLQEGLVLQAHGCPATVDCHEHHLAAPVAGVSGEAAVGAFVVAHGGFAQAEATLLPKVVQADAAVSHPPGHCVGQGHVADDEQAGVVRQFCHLYFLVDVLSHFLFLY